MIRTSTRALALLLLIASAVGCDKHASKENPKETSGSAAPDAAKAPADDQLAKDAARIRAAHDAEVARWTPAMHAEAEALARSTFPDGAAAVEAALTSKARRPASLARDPQRHPRETLALAGFTPGMTVLEYQPGDGWWTEILAPALATQGKLIVTNTDPHGAADDRSTLYGQAFEGFLETSPELYGKVEVVLVDPKVPGLPIRDRVDLVIVSRALHNLASTGTLGAWLQAFHAALVPGGTLLVEQHRAKADAVAADSGKLGYLPEAWVIDQIEAAGFSLAQRSEINANPKDTKDYPDGVWTLPPTFRLGDQDRARYEAIGESDRMTLTFVKRAPEVP